MSSYTVGWVHNFHDPTVATRASTVIAIAVAFPVVSFLFHCPRIALRIRSRKLGMDDIAASCSLGLAIVYSTTTILQTRWGLGLNMQEIPPENVITFSKFQYAGGPVYCLAVLGFKLSLLFAYLRLAGGIQYYARVLYIAIGLVSVNQIIFACLLSLACDPVAKQWDPTIHGSCFDQVASYFGLGGTSLGLDLIIIALPFPPLIRLQLSRTRKIVVAALFAVGFFITIIQVIRIFYIANLADYTNSERIIEWSIIEINLGIIIASIPTYGNLFQKCVEHGRQTGRYRNSKDVQYRSKQSPARMKHTFGSATNEVDTPTNDRLWEAEIGCYNE